MDTQIEGIDVIHTEDDISTLTFYDICFDMRCSVRKFDEKIVRSNGVKWCHSISQYRRIRIKMNRSGKSQLA